MTKMMITESKKVHSRKGEQVKYKVVIPEDMAPVLGRTEPIRLIVTRKDMNLTDVARSPKGREHLNGMSIRDCEVNIFSKVKIKEAKPDGKLPIVFSTVLVHGKEGKNEFERKLREFITNELSRGVTSSNISAMLRKDN